ILHRVRGGIALARRGERCTLTCLFGLDPSELLACGDEALERSRVLVQLRSTEVTRGHFVTPFDKSLTYFAAGFAQSMGSSWACFCLRAMCSPAPRPEPSSCRTYGSIARTVGETWAVFGCARRRSSSLSVCCMAGISSAMRRRISRTNWPLDGSDCM